MEKKSVRAGKKAKKPQDPRPGLLIMLADRVRAIRILEAEIRDLHKIIDELEAPAKKTADTQA